MVRPCLRLLAALWMLVLCARLSQAETFRIAQYNVENYLDEPTATRVVKPEAAKTKVRESILAMKPDVIALEEMGSTNALIELQTSLKAGGLTLPFWEHITSFDTNIHVAILSRFPFTSRCPHTNDFFRLGGRRFQVARGFAEVEIQASANYSFTLIAAHLKSRRQIAEADEAELRFEEAKLLRQLIDARLTANSNLHLVVLGDFNDIPDSEPIKTILGGRGKKGLIDTRPAERNGDDPPISDHHINSRKIAWTHYYAKDDIYSRVDYILLSHAMARNWQRADTYIPTIPNWGVGSDHRPLVATFSTDEKLDSQRKP